MQKEQKGKVKIPDYPQRIRSRFYFTQLSIVSELLNQELHRCFADQRFVISQLTLNEQQDISNVKVTYQYVKTTQPKVIHLFQISIIVLQIQTSIKFHMNFRQSISPQNKDIQQKFQHRKTQIKSELQAQKILSGNHFSYNDQFWINYKSYLPKRLHQAYKVNDLLASSNQQKFIRLLFIFDQRILKQILQFVHSDRRKIGGKGDFLDQMIPQKSPNAILIQALASNYLKINMYLKPKQYKNLCICSRGVYLCLVTQINFKTIFERKWGRTGFLLQEKDWIKMYKNKIIAATRSQSVSARSFQMFIS